MVTGFVLVGIGLALVLVLQLAIISKQVETPPCDALRLHNKAEARARSEIDDLERAATRRVETIVNELRRYHDHLADDLRARAPRQAIPERHE